MVNCSFKVRRTIPIVAKITLTSSLNFIFFFKKITDINGIITTERLIRKPALEALVYFTPIVIVSTEINASIPNIIEYFKVTLSTFNTLLRKNRAVTRNAVANLNEVRLKGSSIPIPILVRK